MLGLLNPLLGIVKSVLGVLNPLLGIVKSVLGVLNELLGIVKSVLAVLNPLVKSMLGLLNPLLGIVKSILGLLNPLLGIVLLGIVKSMLQSICVHLGPISSCWKQCSSAERYKKWSTVGLVRPKTRDKWLKVSHDAGGALIHDVIVQLYHFDCYATSH